MAECLGATTGAGNVGIGVSCGRYQVTGTYNALGGSYAARGPGTAGLSFSYNSIWGAYGGFGLTTGSYNSILGGEAGYSLSTGASNIFLGYQAGYRQTINSNLFIVDNQARAYVDRSEPYLCLLYGNIDADATARDLNINTNVLVRTASNLGSESLSETDFTTHADWDVTGDFDDTGGNATYVHNTGAGTLTQTSANMAVVGVPNGYYKFTYTMIGNAPDGAATITTAFAVSAVSLDLTAGTHTVYFQATPNPGNFIISATSASGSTNYSLDNFTLKQLQGGNMTVNKIMRCKRLLAGGIAA